MIISNAVSNSDAPATNSSSASNTAAATAASDFESFLTLLTAQLRHQDPLSPLDSTQFVEQLASFSAVEQQIETNKLLGTLNSKISGSGLDDAALWIGKEVETISGAAIFKGEPLSYKIPESPSGGAAEVVVTDARGEIVFRSPAQAGGGEFTWSGENLNGGAAPNGQYQVTVNYRDGEEIVDSREPVTLSEITEARLVDTEVKLVLASGTVVDKSEIIALKQKSQGASNDAAGL